MYGDRRRARRVRHRMPRHRLARRLSRGLERGFLDHVDSFGEAQGPDERTDGVGERTEAV